MSAFIHNYLLQYREHGNAFFIVSYSNNEELLDAYTEAARNYTWGWYEVKTGTDGWQLILKIRPLADAYEYQYRHALDQFLTSAMAAPRNLQPDWVLDVGGSESWYTQGIRNTRVVVVDLSPLRNPWVRPRPSMSKVLGCGQELPIVDESVPLALCFEVLEHLGDDEARRQMLHELHRVLQRNGALLFSTPQTDDAIGLLQLNLRRLPEFHHHGVWKHDRTRLELQKAGFTIVGSCGTAIDFKFLNSYLTTNPRIIWILHFLVLLLELVPHGRRAKFQTIFFCVKEDRWAQAGPGTST